MESIKSYIKYSFTSDWDLDIMAALLLKAGFDSYEEVDDGLICFRPDDGINNQFETELKEFCEEYKINYTRELVENINWNKKWESSFEPVVIDDFCLVKASFHNVDQSEFKHVILIDPEMTFGTGHHETTELMIRFMQNMKFDNMKVFDFGAGTGILAILAEKMGAKKIFACDNDTIAVENIKENSLKNQCSKIKAEFKDNASVKSYTYNIVLANIDKNVLSHEVQNLSLSLKKGGFLLISGIMLKDKEEIIRLFEQNSLKLMKVLEKGEWVAMKFIAY